MPAFLAQLAVPGTQLIRAVVDGGAETVYLFDTERESFAALTADGEGWTVRQGGPVAVWDAVEEAVTAWRDVGQPGISAVCMQVTDRAHVYWIGEKPALRWEHRVA